jgi:hypothetical protein
MDGMHRLTFFLSKIGQKNNNNTKQSVYIYHLERNQLIRLC